jgi:hypothetical protein
VIAMSYLTTPELDEFDKAVISVWFKVPQASLDAAQKEEDDWYDEHSEDDDPPPPPPLLGLVPLLVFGKEGTGNSKVESENSPSPHTETHSLHSCATVDATYDNSWPTCSVSWDNFCGDSSYETHWSEVTVSYSATPGKPTNPSYVAIDGSGHLRINFESTKMAEVSGFCGLTSGSSDHTTGGHTDLCCHYPITSGCGGGSESVTDPLPGTLCGLMMWVFGMIGLHMLTAVADNCEIGGGGGNEFVEGTAEYGPVPADFGTGAIGVSLPNTQEDQPLAGDAWHHVLISVDMSEGAAASGGGGISASCTMYVAIDDKDYKTGSYPLEGTNKVVPGGAAFVTNLPGGENCGPGSYSLTDMTVPSAPVGIPSVEKYVDKIRKVQMAELLFFTGVTLDTSKEDNRRHFITAPGKDGFQRPTNSAPLYIPMRKFAIGDPATWEPGADNPAWAPPLFDPSIVPTAARLDGDPTVAQIDFTRCQWNWQMGLNLGKLHGKVEKTGKIKALIPPRDEMPKIQAGGE